MTSEQQKLSEEIRAADARALKAIDSYNNLREQCVKHLAVFMNQGKKSLASCAVCGKTLGWHCDKSPDHVCHYFSEDGKVQLIDGTMVPVSEGNDASSESDDSCIFCGEPEERK